MDNNNQDPVKKPSTSDSIDTPTTDTPQPEADKTSEADQTPGVDKISEAFKSEPVQDKAESSTDEATKEESVPASSDSGGLKRVLIVEDERDARKIYLDLLEGAGYEVAGAENGKEALTQMEQKQFDLVLLDIIMPEMDGIETLENIKKFPDKYGDGKMKILMLSNIGGDIAIDKAMEIGADGYMLKSETEPADLINIVEKYLE